MATKEQKALEALEVELTAASEAKRLKKKESLDALEAKLQAASDAAWWEKERVLKVYQRADTKYLRVRGRMPEWKDVERAWKVLKKAEGASMDAHHKLCDLFGWRRGGVRLEKGA